jgi:hypothetical protein
MEKRQKCPLRIAILMKKYIYTIILTTLAVWQVFADDFKTNDWGSMTNKLQMAISIIPPNSKAIKKLGPETNYIQSLRPHGYTNEIRVNEAFSLLVRIKNSSTNEAYSSYVTIDANPDLRSGLACTVISPSGKDMSPHPAATHTTFFSGSFIVVSPQQIGEFEFKLSDLCRLSEAGIYTITAKKEFRASEVTNRFFTVLSNPLKVSVAK